MLRRSMCSCERISPVVAPQFEATASQNSRIIRAARGVVLRYARRFGMRGRILGFVAASLVLIAQPVLAEKTAGDVVDDNTVNASVKAKLVEAKDVPSMQVNVETYKGTVLLSGFVETQAQKDAAGAAAESVSGVKHLHNALAIHPSTSMGTKLDDTVITGKVKAALMDDADVKSGQINVETKGGIVQLGGFVTGEKMQKRALEIAKGVSGVTKVEDAMYVKPKD
jgi:hyperosmotically inducible protein